jgi:hypothetical protein
MLNQQSEKHSSNSEFFVRVPLKKSVLIEKVVDHAFEYFFLPRICAVLELFQHLDDFSCMVRNTLVS